MVKIARRRLARELVRLLTQQPARKDELLRQTAAYLLHTKQAHQLHLLMNDVADELTVAGHLTAEVQSALGLSDDSRQAIIVMLQQTTGAKTVELTETTAPELLGGVVVRTPRFELNASVKRHLMQLAGGMK
jgi:F0F1-type ATP synthase delta subunit